MNSGSSVLCVDMWMAVALASSMLATTSADAQIVGAPNVPGNLRPTVLVAPNGVPLINVQTPSADGVSRNVYSAFNVGTHGAILNNSRTAVQTQLGGFVQGNPSLATGPARIILNEVNGGTPSQLRGYIEVGGQRAEVIIANPAGISVDGGGFINASRATLTTGTPQFNAVGGLDSFLVRGGTVTIDGGGLDASKTDYAAILARAVQANASIWASELKVVTGANQISADHSQTTPTAGTGSAPIVALDVAALGGMYANKIVLIGSEAGLGVRNAGHIGAGAGGFVVTAAGRLENIGTLEGQRVELTTPGDIVNRGGTIRQTGTAGLTIASPVLSNTNGGVIGVEPASVGAGTGGTSGGGTTTPAPGATSIWSVPSYPTKAEGASAPSLQTTTSTSGPSPPHRRSSPRARNGAAIEPGQVLWHDPSTGINARKATEAKVEDSIVTGGVLGAMDLNPTGLPTLNGGAQPLVNQLRQNLTAGAVRAVVGTAINGGSFEKNLKDGLKNAMLDTMVAQAAHGIGDLTKKDGVLDDFTNKVAHAIAGCMVGAVRADNAAGCGAGALGAAMGELAAEAYGRRADTTQFAAMVAGLAVAIAGGDVAQINLGSQAGSNAAANNFLDHAQWDELSKRFAACQQKADGCSAVDERALRDEYVRLSAAQDKELATTCGDPGTPACRKTLDQAQQGAVYQQALVEAAKLPEYYWGGSDFNANVRLVQQRVDAYDVVAACAANPSQCDQRRLQGSARLLFTGVSVAAMTVLAAEVGIVGLGVAGGGLVGYCGTNPQRCLSLVNAVAEVTTGAVNPTSPTLGGTRPGAATQARGFGQYGVTRYVDANGNAIEVGNVIPGGLGNTGLALGSAEAIARAPLNLIQVSGEASFVTRVSMSNLARNDGKLGEAVALDLMQNSTGLSFRAIQNNSGHGVDLLGIDDANKIVWAPEVKSSINGAFPDPSTLNLMQRTQEWIREAADGKINNQKIDAADIAYARQVQRLLKFGDYQLKPLVINVSIPRQNTSGLASATAIPIN